MIMIIITIQSNQSIPKASRSSGVHENRGRGWPSVLNTHLSNEIELISSNRRYRYFNVSAKNQLNKKKGEEKKINPYNLIDGERKKEKRKIPWHIIKLSNILSIDISNARITIFRTCMFLDSLENLITMFSPFNISSSPPQNKNTFNSLWKKKEKKDQQKRKR